MTVAGLTALRAERETLVADGGVEAWEALCRRLGDPVDLDDLAAMQAPVAGDRLRDFGRWGKHPMHLWADGLVHESVVVRCFDGDGAVFPASIGAALAWFESALPQVAGHALLGVLDRPVALVAVEPRTLWRVGDGVALGTSSDGVRVAAATVRADPVGLLRFASGRSHWRDEPLSIEGDIALAHRVLDEVRI